MSKALERAMSLPGIGVTITGVDNPQSSGMTIADGYRKILTAALDREELTDIIHGRVCEYSRDDEDGWGYCDKAADEIIKEILGGAE